MENFVRVSEHGKHAQEHVSFVESQALYPVSVEGCQTIKHDVAVRRHRTLRLARRSRGVVVVDHSPSIRFTQSDRINSVTGTVQSASVAAGRVLVASIENATNTDSISGKVVVNYHYI